MADISITFDQIRAELGRLAFENMVLRAENAALKAASAAVPVPPTPEEDEHPVRRPVDEITGVKRPPLHAVDNAVG